MSYGILIEGHLDREALLEIGFLGGMTTFSSYTLESYDLIQKQKFGYAFFYMIGSPIFGVIGFWAALVINGGLLKMKMTAPLAVGVGSALGGLSVFVRIHFYCPLPGLMLTHRFF